MLFVFTSNTANKLVQYYFLVFCKRRMLNNIPKIFDNLWKWKLKFAMDLLMKLNSFCSDLFYFQ